MATINSRKIVDEIIAGDGYYPGDHDRCLKIVQYNNNFNGGLAYGLIYRGQPLDAYETSPFCHNPVVLWEAK